MVTKVSSVYRVDIPKHSHQQSRDGSKKKDEIQFKDVLAKLMVDSVGKSTR